MGGTVLYTMVASGIPRLPVATFVLRGPIPYLRLSLCVFCGLLLLLVRNSRILPLLHRVESSTLLWSHRRRLRLSFVVFVGRMFRFGFPRYTGIPRGPLLLTMRTRSL